MVKSLLVMNKENVLVEGNIFVYLMIQAFERYRENNVQENSGVS